MPCAAGWEEGRFRARPRSRGVAAPCGGLRCRAHGLLRDLGDGEWRRMLLLGGIALIKGGVTLGLVLDSRGLLGRRRVRDLVRSGEFVVGVGLLAYGLVTMAVSGYGLVVALGASEPEPAAVAASWGHLLIWDPLFALWGMGTAAYVVRASRRPSGLRRPV